MELETEINQNLDLRYFLSSNSVPLGKNPSDCLKKCVSKLRVTASLPPNYRLAHLINKNLLIARVWVSRRQGLLIEFKRLMKEAD